MGGGNSKGGKMTEGWIKIHRKIKDWQHFQEPITVLVWLYLLTTAQTKDTWYRGERLRRGELFTSLDAIREATGINPKSVRKSLASLAATGEIEITATRKGHKIRVNQYFKYQCSVSDTQRSTQRDTQRDTQQGTQPIIEEYKESKNINNIPPQNARAREGDFKILGTFKNVKLTDGDIESLRMDFASQGLPDDFLDRCIDRLSAYMAQEGRTYLNHRAAILSWAKTAVLEDDRRTGTTTQRQPQAKQRIMQMWQSLTDEEKKQHLDRNGGVFPWDDPKYIEQYG